MKNLIIFMLISVTFLASCTITQSYTFNKDFSGTSEVQLEMGELISFINSMDTSGNGNSLDTLNNVFAQLSQTLETAGAKNVETGWTENNTTIYLKYDFSDIDNLNSIAKSTAESNLTSFSGNSGKNINFTQKGKKTIIYDAPEVDNDTLKNNEQIAAMKDYLKYETVFTFASEIKKIDNKRAVISADKKTVKFSGNITEVLSEDFTFDFTLKLK